MTVTQASSIFQRILDYSSRADPYPLYAELRKTPVARQEDGSYIVSTYREITRCCTTRISVPTRTISSIRDPPSPWRGHAGVHRPGPAASTTGCGAWRCGTSAPRTRPR